VLSRIIISIVLVFPFENSTSDRNLDWLREGISELIVGTLQPDPQLTVFTRDERLAAYDKLTIPEAAVVSRATSMKIGWDSGADFIVTGRFAGTTENFQIAARVINLATSSAGPEIKASGKLEDIVSMTAALGSELRANAVGAVYDRPGAHRAPLQIPSSAFENYTRGIISTDPDKRAEYLQTAIRLHPQFTDAIFQLGRSYHEQRDFKNSNASLERIPVTHPLYLQAQFMIGLNRFYLGEFASAAAAFEKLLPANYDVLVNLGAAYLSKGEHVSALLAWRRAQDLDPLSAEAFFNSGYLSFLQNQNEAAVRDLSQSLKVRGRDSEALFLLGRAYEKLGRAEEAQRVTAQSTRLSQRVERWLTQPLPKLERLRPSTTFRDSKQIWTEERLKRRTKGQDLASWLESIQTKVDAYQYGEAVRELQNVLRIHPDSAEAKSLLEEVNARRNR